MTLLLGFQYENISEECVDKIETPKLALASASTLG
jgi:hypothetical protein